MTPERWAVLGQAIRDDRHRRGLTLQDLEARTAERGTRVSSRTIGSLERGGRWKSKPPSLEPVVAALGWRQRWTDRILDGEDPDAVLGSDDPLENRGSAGPASRAQLLELLPDVHKFGQLATRLGAPADLRDGFDRLIQWAFDAVPGARISRTDLDLAAARSHAPGEGVPADDVARIRDALKR